MDTNGARVFEMPPDHLTGLGDKLVAVAVHDEEDASLLVVTTIKALRTVLSRRVLAIPPVPVPAPTPQPIGSAVPPPLRRVGAEPMPPRVPAPSPQRARKSRALSVADNEGARLLRMEIARFGVTFPAFIQQLALDVSQAHLSRLQRAEAVPSLELAVTLEERLRIPMRSWLTRV
jgi:hypothetical protein